MKKIFPTIFLLTLFLTVFVSQMFLNGRELSASHSESKNQKANFLELEYQKIEGNQFDGKEFNKKILEKDYVVVNFWASWCVPCIPKLDVLESLSSRINVIGINMDDSSTKINALKIIKEKKLNFPNIKDEDNSIGNKFLVKTLPFTLLFKNGKLVKSFQGFEKLTEKKISKYFD